MEKRNITPIVTVMGHVDHGKTSLLDKIRDANVAVGEAGGITQSVRAHQIITKVGGEDKKITFIDTPGHEAFSKMRSRGAQVGNIALIVVAVNEGVKPQTIEACKFAVEEKIPIIIAFTKIDMPSEADSKIFSQLAQNGILVEEMGGDAIVARVSSKTGEGIQELLNTIFLVHEMHNSGITIEVDPHFLAEGIVLESNTDKKLGPLALVILKKGEIQNQKSKNLYAANEQSSSKLRTILNADLKEVNLLTAGDPVWLVGIEKVLNVGQIIRFFDNEKDAANEVKNIKVEQDYSANINNDPISAFAAMFAKQSTAKTDENKKILKVILRTDTRGSMEVAKAEIEKLSDEFAEVIIKDQKESEISESDIKYAKDTGAIIIGFRTGISDRTMKLAMHEKVLVRNYEIIYEMIEELEGALLGLTTPEDEEIEVSRAKIKQAFKLTNGQYVAGCVVNKGKMIKGYRVFVERNGEEIGRGKIIELRILKNAVKEVDKGKECGILLEPNIEVADGDEIVAFKIEKI